MLSNKLPKISIITPSYNQARFIEETIKSVLSQEYPSLEYIVMDGGSTDGSLDIIKKYKDKLIWFSRKDKGQSDAINKGMKKASGDIIGYLNSDDYLEKNSLLKIADFFINNRNAYWVTGKCKIVNKKNIEVRKCITFYKNLFLKFFRFKTVNLLVQFISQPATFWRRDVIGKVGYFDESLNYDMDYDYWLRLWSKFKLYYIDDCLASYRVHRGAKAVISPETQFKVEYEIARRYTDSNLLLLLHKLHSNLALFVHHTFFSNNRSS